MASGDAEARAAVEGAELWDAAADERQRLADEREQLSNERENLANERERLADEHERLLDERNADHAEDVRLGRALDERADRVEAEGTLARAEARLQRALAERTRAELALERQAVSLERRDAAVERSADRSGDTGDDVEAWQLERRGFVAVERGRLAALRDVAQDTRDQLADTRDRGSDLRDREARVREDAAARRETEQLRGAASATAHERVCALATTSPRSATPPTVSGATRRGCVRSPWSTVPKPVVVRRRSFPMPVVRSCERSSWS